MTVEFDNIKIRGMCSAVPTCIEDNNLYVDVIGERRTRKQIKLTGVEKRHVSNSSQSASDLCFVAAKKLVTDLELNLGDIKILILVTQGPDFQIPSTAFLLHKRLGLSKDCVCFDMNLGCTAFNIGLQTAASMLQAGNMGDKALLCIGDSLGIKLPYRAFSPDEIAKSMLFGAAGVCVAIEKVEHGVISILNNSDGERYKTIYGELDAPSTMDGGAVFSFAIGEVADTLKQFRYDHNLPDDKIDYYVFHQAQKLILDDISQSCQIPAEKELRSYSEYGNTSGASAILSVCANRDNLKNKEANYLFCTFGVGLSWGCIYTSIEKSGILPVVESDEHYAFRPVSRSAVTNIVKMNDYSVTILNADCDFGEWLTRFCHDHGGRPTLIGKDIEVLKKIAEDQPVQTLYYTMDEINKSELNTKSWIKEGEVKQAVLVVLNLNSITEEMYKKLSKSTEADSIVLVGSYVDIDELEKAKQCIDNVFTLMGEEYSGRINGVLYSEKTTDIVPLRGNGQDWFEQYARMQCPENMTKASYISWAIEYLISEAGRYTNHTVLYED